MQIDTYGLSDVGLVRKRNEDAWGELPMLQFFVLADGMGGHNAGDEASRVAVSKMCELVETWLSSCTTPFSLEELGELLGRGVELVNEAIYSLGLSKRHLRGMGTTLSSLCIRPEGGVFAHVGDSRIYQFREDRLMQLTEDHSMLNRLARSGCRFDKQSAQALYKGVLTRAVGTDRQVTPQIGFFDVQPGDLYLLCSDGLTDMLEDVEIETVLQDHSCIKGIAEEMLEEAIRKGGHDNITVMVVGVRSGNETS